MLSNKDPILEKRIDLSLDEIWKHFIKSQITISKFQIKINFQYSMTKPMESNTIYGLFDKSIDKHIGGLICLYMEDRLKVTP